MTLVKVITLIIFLLAILACGGNTNQRQIVVTHPDGQQTTVDIKKTASEYCGGRLSTCYFGCNLPYVNKKDCRKLCRISYNGCLATY